MAEQRYRRKVRFPLAGAPPGPPAGKSGESTGEVLSVGALTRGIRRILETSFPLVAVRGEVCALGQPSSGHMYFTLRDDCGTVDAQLAVVLWRDDALRLRFRLEEGIKVVVRGRLTVYEPRGSYQVIASAVEPAGAGELALAFERLKRRLSEEGLFAPERKRRLPFLPRAIGLITSPTGAAIADVLRSILRRHPGAWVRIFPVRVQGEGSAAEVAAALDLAGRPEFGVDVAILARGGGSPEDLWTFNEEAVVRAVAACRVPVVSAIGHEVDFTLCDFVADARAQTPTQAGDLVVPEVDRLRRRLEELAGRREGAALRRFGRAREALDRLSSRRVLRAPEEWVVQKLDRLEGLGKSLAKNLYTTFESCQNQVQIFSDRLDALSPLNVLRRGYSIVFDPQGRVVRDVADLRVRDEVRLLLGKGSARAIVERIEEEAGGRG